MGFTSHDVRSLRVCHECGVPGHKKDFIVDGTMDLCPKCAIDVEGGLDGFMARYTRGEWEKLPLYLIGAKGMQKLLAAYREKGQS